MKNLPKISVITPTYNAEKMIESCLKSVVDQTYVNKEHIIIDGHSQDKTLEIVKKYSEKYPHIRWVSEKDEGIYDAMNKGIDMAEGEWLYFLGSDDIFFDKYVLQKIFTNNNYPEREVIYGNAKFKISGELYDGKFNSYKLLRKNICHQAIFYKRNIFHKLGKYDTKYRALADWVFNMKWFNDSSISREYLSDVIAVYNEDGYCFNNPDDDFTRDYRILIKKYFPSLPLYLFYKRNNRLIRYLIYLLYGYREQS